MDFLQDIINGLNKYSERPVSDSVEAIRAIKEVAVSSFGSSKLGLDAMRAVAQLALRSHGKEATSTCPTCGHPLPALAKYCGNCGARTSSNGSWCCGNCGGTCGGVLMKAITDIKVITTICAICAEVIFGVPTEKKSGSRRQGNPEA